MRRSGAMLLLVCFSLPLIWPVVLLYGSERSLPACCRGDGKHRCGMRRNPAGPDFGPTLQPARCASYPSATGFPATPEGTPGVTPQGILSVVPIHSAAQPRAEALLRFAYSRCGQKRGPPCIS